MKYRIHPEAEHEADEAADWYGVREPRLGIEFARQFSLAIDDIFVNPLRYAIAEDSPIEIDCRNVLHLGRFPYRIVYAIVDESIFVIAVAHHSRRPRYWHDRLTEQNPELG